MPQENQIRNHLLRSFGRRKGRNLRPTKQGLFDTLLPRLEISLPEARVLKPDSRIWLEIGFGSGEHLIHLARLHPEIQFIGCEQYINGIASFLTHINKHNSYSFEKEITQGRQGEVCITNPQAGFVSNKNKIPPVDFVAHEPKTDDEKNLNQTSIENILIYSDDARNLIMALPDNSLECVFILYPDPWLKTRHHKRRIISTDFLNSLARVMKTGAKLQLATDSADYATWMLERLLAHPAFKWTAKTCDDWLNPPAEWISTRYEQKALAGIPTYLCFKLI